MQDHGFVGKINKWLRETKCQWPQPSTKTSHQNKGLHREMLCLTCQLNSQNLSSGLVNIHECKIKYRYMIDFRPLHTLKSKRKKDVLPRNSILTFRIRRTNNELTSRDKPFCLLLTGAMLSLTPEHQMQGKEEFVNIGCRKK